MSKKPPALPIEHLLQIMQKAFEARFSCQISFYTGDFAAVIHFFSDNPLGDPLLTARVYSSGNYNVLPPKWVQSDIHDLAVVMKRADTLLGLLRTLYQS